VDGVTSFDREALAQDGWNSNDAGFSYSKTGTYGTASLALSSGIVSYQLDNGDNDTQALTLSESVTESFTLYLHDDQGATSSVDAAFEILGSNDNPVAADTAGNAVEASGESNTTPGSNASGNVLNNVSDVDTKASGETITVIGVATGSEDATDSAGNLGTPLAGEYGNLTLNPDGSYIYVVDENNAEVEALRVTGQQLIDSFTYIVSDASGLQDQATLSIAIDGRNDAPSLTNTSLLADWDYNNPETRDFSTLFHDVDAVSNGEQLSYTITGLPSGLNYDANTGMVSGQPTEVGLFTLMLTVQDTAGIQTSRTFELEIVSDATPVTDDAPATSEEASTAAEDTASQSDNAETVNIVSTELPDGLVNNAPGDDGSAFIQGDPNNQGSLDINLDSGISDNFVSNTQDDRGTESEDAAADTLSMLDGQNEESGGSTGGDEIVLLSEQGAIVIETNTPGTGGNTVIRAVVEVNVASNGAVEFSESQNDAFELVSLYLSNIQHEETAIQLTISDNLVDKVKLYTGSLGDGSPLPAWIQVDSRSGNLSINPPDNLEDLIVRIRAIDNDGQVRILELNLNQLLQNLNHDQTGSDSLTDSFIPLSEQLRDVPTSNYGEQLAILLTN
jgi:VCBS repeat-containing protein